MSPLELAKAFDAPMLRDQYSNAEVNNMVRNADSQLVQYGRLRDMHNRSVSGERIGSNADPANEHGQPGKKLVFANPAAVQSL
jgi:hypothetical protein